MIIKRSKTTRLSIDQKEMRTVFLGGFAGQLVSGLIWLAASGTSILINGQYGIAVLFFGSMGIFPLTKLTLHMMGRSVKVNEENGLWELGYQISLTVPINFLLVVAIILYRPMWFFPGTMIAVGAHYLPFITLYGMKMFGVLAAMLIFIGTGLALYGPQIFSLGGWLTGVILITFAFIGRAIVLKEERIDNKSENILID